MPRVEGEKGGKELAAETGRQNDFEGRDVCWTHPWWQHRNYVIEF